MNDETKKIEVMDSAEICDRIYTALSMLELSKNTLENDVEVSPRALGDAIRFAIKELREIVATF